MSVKMTLTTPEEERYAFPMNHPVTCANPAPWLIEEVRVELSCLKVCVWIRNRDSMWFLANQCHLGLKEELLDWK